MSSKEKAVERYNEVSKAVGSFFLLNTFSCYVSIVETHVDEDYQVRVTIHPKGYAFTHEEHLAVIDLFESLEMEYLFSPLGMYVVREIFS